MMFEYNSLDFDSHEYEDRNWWRQQDADMEREELERIESQAEIEEYRLNGYGE